MDTSPLRDRQRTPLVSAPPHGASPGAVGDGHVESQQLQQVDKESGAESSSKQRKRKVRFADGVALEDGDSRQRLHKMARQLSQMHSFSVDSAAPEASQDTAAHAEGCGSSSGRTLRPRSCRVSRD